MSWCTKTKLFFVLTLSWVAAQEYIENLHDSKVGTHLKELPKSFEVKGFDANTQFQKYFDQIQDFAMQRNLNVIYKIKLDVDKPTKYHTKKTLVKKGRSKKYNIPLKKTSMKLSNFEMWLRKMAEQSGANKKGTQQNFENYPAVTTEGEKIITTTKQIQLKYKPIISKMKSNYTKIVKPVRSRTITLIQ
ncbi:uncharacterized protein LOC111356340 [Spodoptera litura]|uniref:Uncharacterized protein LOC111356340 n=1 Tax=Spodoptera litura TaxID=69820 RepID=A0A9J7EE78_SPOLT|nr:uncharacterized protein LOC111356340 [Spodoptera litura]